MIKYAPIIVTVYDRLDHLKRCIDSLLLNDLACESELIIISDAAYREIDVEKIEAVRKYALSVVGFKKKVLLFRDKNMGAHKSAGEGIKDVLKMHDRFLFLEDDIVVAPDFLRFINEGLSYYENDINVFSICGFTPDFKLPQDYQKDIYFYPCNSPWGFATWRDRWEKVNRDRYDRYSELKKDKDAYKRFVSIGFYIKGILLADSKGEIEAGDLRIYYHMFKNNMCSVYPVKSKTQNWGFDGTGEHCGNKNFSWVKPRLEKSDNSILFERFEVYDQKILRSYCDFQDKINGGILAKYFKYTWIHRLYRQLKQSI